MTDRPDEEPADGTADAPLADLADRVAERRKRDTADAADPFEAPVIDQSAAEPPWRDGTEGAAPEAGGEAAADTVVVSKRNFCERCPHFSEPPLARCTNEGTDILEFPDKDHVRVRDCPIVEERGVATGPSSG